MPAFFAAVDSAKRCVAATVRVVVGYLSLSVVGSEQRLEPKGLRSVPERPASVRTVHEAPWNIIFTRGRMALHACIPR
jgi:hypothetical protein